MPSSNFLNGTFFRATISPVWKKKWHFCLIVTPYLFKQSSALVRWITKWSDIWLGDNCSSSNISTTNRVRVVIGLWVQRRVQIGVGVRVMVTVKVRLGLGVNLISICHLVQWLVFNQNDTWNITTKNISLYTLTKTNIDRLCKKNWDKTVAVTVKVRLGLCVNLISSCHLVQWLVFNQNDTWNITTKNISLYTLTKTNIDRLCKKKLR